MDTNQLVDRLGCAPRAFAGRFQMPALPHADSPFSASIKISLGDAAVCIEGSFRHAGLVAAVPFSFTWPLADEATFTPSAQLSCALVGDVSGPLLISTDGFEFIATTPSATVTLNLRFMEPESLLVKGMVLRKEGSLAFSAWPVADPKQRVKARVFAIHPVRD